MEKINPTYLYVIAPIVIATAVAFIWANLAPILEALQNAFL